MGKLKLGIIGCGGISGMHISGLGHFPDRVEIVALCDIVLAKAEAAKARIGGDIKTYADYRELLKDPAIDVVHVCTPNGLHARISIDALNAGKHVLVEKPMAGSAAEAQAMLDASRKNGKLLTVGLQNRNSSPARYLRGMVQAGEFGDIYYARARGMTRRRVPVHGGYLDPKVNVGGCLLDSGPHALDTTLWILGNYKPASVVGRTFDLLGKGLQPHEQANFEGAWDPAKFGVEDTAIGFVTMENGALVTVESAWAVNMAVNDYAQTTFSGTRGGASMEDGPASGKPYKLTLNGVRGGRQYEAEVNYDIPVVKDEPKIPTFPLNTYRAFRIWLDALEGKGEVLVKPEECVVLARIFDGIYESARTGKMVRL